MFRIAVRNILIMLGVALPIALATALLIGWMSSERRISIPLIDELGAELVLVYVFFGLPALVLAVIHQVLLAALPRTWSARTTRIVILATSLGLVAVLPLLFLSSPFRGGSMQALALVPSAVAYGLMAQPLRPPRLSTTDE